LPTWFHLAELHSGNAAGLVVGAAAALAVLIGQNADKASANPATVTPFLRCITNLLHEGLKATTARWRAQED
jgi:hypothetical protein